MKVVLFSGGLGLRLREYSDVAPKPMIPIGVRPDPVARDALLRRTSGTRTSCSVSGTGPTS